ncbi:DUF551 domain-containing protein [Citrobacter freundii]|uniref:DUF551 domain-containing protein n=1 Tax=Citrobacter freundii TaxID=546 RepID=UPI001FFE173C|nr:DUF551 domain-containing protein [Citrobacter freundii]
MTFTKEQLQHIIETDHVQCGDASALARMALAGMEAEPVAWAHRLINKRNGVVHPWVYGSAEACPSEGDIFNIEVMPLYTAPPAPVSVPDAMEMDDDFDSAFEHGKAVGWSAYRAAMLQAGNHTEQHLNMVGHPGDANENVDCRLPFDQWLSQKNEPIDVDCGCVTTEAFYHWLRVAYEAGNSPVTLDGYVLVPKEMTDEIGEAIALQANCCGGIALDIYDAMLEAAPQQEVKS